MPCLLWGEETGAMATEDFEAQWYQATAIIGLMRQIEKNSIGRRSCRKRVLIIVERVPINHYKGGIYKADCDEKHPEWSGDCQCTTAERIHRAARDTRCTHSIGSGTAHPAMCAVQSPIQRAWHRVHLSVA